MFEITSQLQTAGLIACLVFTGWFMFKVGQGNGEFWTRQELEEKHQHELLCAHDTSRNGWRNAAEFLNQNIDLKTNDRVTNRILAITLEELKVARLERDEANRRAGLSRFPITSEADVIDMRSAVRA